MNDINYKIKGNIAGYVAVFLLIVIFILTIYLTTMDIHFKYDIFTMLILASAFERCRDTYLEYRKREIDEMIEQEVEHGR